MGASNKETVRKVQDAWNENRLNGGLRLITQIGGQLPQPVASSR
jgi:hypothetical protein